MLRMNSVFFAFILLTAFISSSSFAQSSSNIQNTSQGTQAASSASSKQTNSKQNSAIARLFGEPITLADITPDQDTISKIRKQAPDNVTQLVTQMRAINLANQIIEAVLSDYASTHNIKVDSALVDIFKQKFGAEYEKNNQKVAAKKDAQQNDKGLEESASAEDITSIDEIASTQVERWQIEKHLYNTYGGVVIFEQSNPSMPVEAYLTLMKEYESKGKFQVVDEALAERFWEAFKPPYEFVIAAEDVDFSQPWWR
ncbi:hypothetical protein [Alteromonas lipotrueae]|uniref:hypothetical protein n=1 Tax=Alteromonas lipotrueae TaxID=2803814 RepID=UPI001C442772|nr:hypothetical protein [Alteromonas lipotrueae]